MWVPLLVVAWAAVLLSCVRLCRAALAAADEPRPEPGAPEYQRPECCISLYETAFLAGGPQRVTDLTLVSMSRERRLLLAHTGWATVVDPDGRDELERSVITAIGPEGQSRIPAIRAALSTADAVRALGERLTAAGLAVPATARTEVADAVRQLRTAALLVLVTGAAAVLTLPPEGGKGAIAAWFALPLVLVTGCLGIARMEMHPYSSWASPAGQRLLGRIDPPARPSARGRDDPSLLTALAVHGPAALPDPALRAALAGGRQARRWRGDG